MIKKIIVIPDETLMQQVTTLIDKVSTIHYRAQDENYVSQKVLDYYKHTTEDKWWFYVDDLTSGMSDYSAPELLLILKLVENMTMIRSQILASNDENLKTNTDPITDRILVVEVSDLEAGGWVAPSQE